LKTYSRALIGASLLQLCASSVVIFPLAASAIGETSPYVISYKSGNAAQALKAVQAVGGTSIEDLSWIDAMAVKLPIETIDALKRNPAIEIIEQDPVRTVQGKHELDASTIALGSYESVPYGIPLVQADQVTYNAANSRTLCIIDSGFDLGHPDLQTSNIDGKNFTRSGSWFTDELAHGTHVSGTIAALGGNGIGVVGVVPSGSLQLYIAKVFDASGSTKGSTVARAVKACVDAGANVISMSLGGGGPSKFEERLYRKVAANNILTVAAAGNGGTTALEYPASYPDVMSVAAVDSNKIKANFSQYNSAVEISGPGVGVISTIPRALSISASVSVNSVVYSAFPMEGSPVITVAAPIADFGLGDTVVPGAMTGMVCLIARGNIAFADKVQNCEQSGGVGAVIYNNTVGDLHGSLAGAITNIPSIGITNADGQILLTQIGQVANVSVFNSTDYWESFNGTSMATPHVSGVAALVWSNQPQCTAAQIRASLDNSALDINNIGYDIFTGFGLVQAKSAVDRIETLGCGN